jgi:hypothetical protein
MIARCGPVDRRDAVILAQCCSVARRLVENDSMLCFDAALCRRLVRDTPGSNHSSRTSPGSEQPLDATYGGQERWSMYVSFLCVVLLERMESLSARLHVPSPMFALLLFCRLGKLGQVPRWPFPFGSWENSNIYSTSAVLVRDVEARWREKEKHREDGRIACD